LNFVETTQLTIVASAFLFAAFVKGVTGLGFSTTALPFLVYALGIKEALPLLIIPSITSNLIVMRDAGQFRSTALRFRWLYLPVVPGIVLGLWFLNWLDPIISSAVLGIALISYCVIAWFQPNFRMGRKISKALEIPVGFTTGLINGLTGSQVMPVLPYLLSLKLERNMFIQAVNVSFTISSLVMAIGLWQLGLMTLESVEVSLLGLVAVLIGVRFGSYVRRWLPPAVFRSAVLTILTVLGVGLIVRLAL
jgi:hypothetical protein